MLSACTTECEDQLLSRATHSGSRLNNVLALSMCAGEYETAHKWINLGANPSATLETLDTEERQIAIGKLPNRSRESNPTLFHFAIHIGCPISLIKSLSEHTTKLWEKDACGSTAAHTAIINNRLDLLAFFIDQRNLNPNISNSKWESLLHTAASINKPTEALDIVKYLYPKVYYPILLDLNTLTPLHYAAYAGNVNIVHFFLDKGGLKVDVRAKNNETPLHLACFSDACASVGVVKALCYRNANDQARNNDLRIPLYHAVHNGHVDIVSFLISLNKNSVNSTDINGNSPLLWACSRSAVGSLESVKLLCKNGAHINETNQARYNAACLAAKHGHLDILDFLIDKNATLASSNTQPSNKSTIGLFLNYLMSKKYRTDANASDQIEIIQAKKAKKAKMIFKKLISKTNLDAVNLSLKDCIQQYGAAKPLIAGNSASSSPIHHPWQHPFAPWKLLFAKHLSRQECFYVSKNWILAVVRSSDDYETGGIHIGNLIFSDIVSHILYDAEGITANKQPGEAEHCLQERKILFTKMELIEIWGATRRLIRQVIKRAHEAVSKKYHMDDTISPTTIP